jgi:acetylornithine deacetylase/succinyl-diaminopimelate desuccinylase-like protein
VRACGRDVILVLALAAPAAAGASPDTLLDAVRAHVRARQADIVREYAELLAIPNVPAEPEGLRRNAEHIAGMLRRRGFEARLLDGAGGPPLVYGTLDVGAPRTLALYAHYDGQPVRPEQWSSPPFTPVLRDGPSTTAAPVDIASLRASVGPEARLFARSVSDDKAPIIAIAAALDALAAAGARPSVNLKLVFEGEEEKGSPHLAAAFALHRGLLRADAWLVCDGPVHQSGRMQVYFGARGTLGLELTVYGPARALHSGHYGNWAPNPAVELAHLVAGLRDRDGRIAIPGWSDEVRPWTAEEEEALAAVPDVDAALRDELSLAETEAGNARLVERIMLPALNVRGLAAGAVGESAANAIPTETRASFDFRLVPDQRPDVLRERFEAHLRAAGYTVVHDAPTLDQRRRTPRLVRLEWEDGYPAARTSLGLPFSRALVRAVGAAGDGTVISLPTLGGSVPLHVFAEAFGVPVVGLPIVNHDNAQHAADENLRLSNLWDGIAVFASVFTGLGTGW